MTYDSDLAEQAAVAPEKRARALMRLLASRLRGGWASWEQELISRLTGLAMIAVELDVVRHVEIRIAVATWAKESGGYQLVRRRNTNGTDDVGWLQENSVHGRSDGERLARAGSILYWRDVLAPRRIGRGQHPLADYRAFTSGAYVDMLLYADEAIRRASAPHPKSWP